MSLLDRMLPEPEFVTRDPAAVTREMVAQYEALAGKSLYPAQLERLLIDVMSYRESLMREAIQDAAKLNLVRYSRGVMLDMLGENVGVARLTGLTNAAGEAVGDEPDDRFRERILLAPERYSNAGSVGAYRYHALSAHVDIIDVAVLSPTPGVVNIHPLIKEGLPSAAVKAAVLAACNADRVRPLTDQVNVLDPVIVDYSIKAGLTLFRGADAALALSEAQKAAEAYRDRQQARLGRDIVCTQIIDVLHGYGVYSVALNSPALDKLIADDQWPRCTAIVITLAGTAQD
jgi:phage-related baseplate assembly protein